MTRGESNYHTQLRESSKEKILNWIIQNPGTFVNAIVDALSMSKTTVSRCVSELIQEKRIMSRLDSYNLEFAEILKLRIKNQLVYCDPIKEEYGRKKFNHDDEKPTDIPSAIGKAMAYLRTPEYLQNQKNTRIRLQKTKASLQEYIANFKNSDESEKKVKAPILEYMLNEYVKLELQNKKLDHRVRHTEWEKILIAYSIHGHYSINQLSKLEKVSDKYISRLSKQYPVSKDDPRYPEFKKMVGCCSCGSSIADGLIEKIKL